METRYLNRSSNDESDDEKVQMDGYNSPISEENENENKKVNQIFSDEDISKNDRINYEVKQLHFKLQKINKVLLFNCSLNHPLIKLTTVKYKVRGQLREKRQFEVQTNSLNDLR